MELDMDIKDGRSTTAVADARQEQYRPLWQGWWQAWAEWEHTPQR